MVKRFSLLALLVILNGACAAPAPEAPASTPVSQATATEIVLPTPSATPTLAPEQLIQLAQDALNRGEWDAAIILLDLTITQNPDVAQSYLLRANAYKELGNNEQALADYDQAIALDVNSAATFHSRALLHSQLGNTDQALADFARAIELEPTFGLAYRNRANVHLTLGNTAAAALDLQIYNTFVPNAPDLESVQAQIAELQAQTVAEAEEDGLLFFDDFSDPTSGWYSNGDPASPTLYAGDGYVLVKEQPQGAVWAMPGRLFSDVRIEVTAHKQRGDDNNFYGVMCRVRGTTDTADFYAFLISSDGFYGIAQRVNGENGGAMTIIDDEPMLFSSAILQGEQSNTITAICSGSRLALYVNGELLTETIDTSLESGQVGLIAGAFDVAGTSIFFDDFIVYDAAPQ